MDTHLSFHMETFYENLQNQIQVVDYLPYFPIDQSTKFFPGAERKKQE